MDLLLFFTSLFPPNMNAQFIRIPTEDQLILQGLVYHPETTTQKAYLHIHGMGGNFYENAFLDVMAREITNVGYAFVSINTRGHDTIADFPIVGEKEEFKRIGNAFEVFEECLFDIKAAIQYLETQGYSQIILCGHSLGAVKVAYYLATTNDSRISRLVLMSPADMVGLAEAEESFERFRTSAQELVRTGKGEELLPEKLWGGYYLSANTYINLSTRDYPVDIFSVYDEAKSSLLSKITVPTLALLGEKDDAVTIPPGQALEIIKRKASSAKSFQIEVIPNATHCYFKTGEAMTKVITNWLTL